MRLKRFSQTAGEFDEGEKGRSPFVWRLENVMCRMSWSPICDASRLLDPWLVDSISFSPSCSFYGAKFAGETHK